MVPKDSWSQMGFLFLHRTDLFPFLHYYYIIQLLCILSILGILIFLVIWLFSCVLLQLHKFYPTSNSIETTQWCKCLCHLSDICKVSIELEVTWFLQIKAHKDIAHFETAYVVKLHRVARLAPPQEVRDCTFCSICPSLIMPSSNNYFHNDIWWSPLNEQVFSFTHPNFSPKATNQRYTKLQFELPQDTGSCLVHGMRLYLPLGFLFTKAIRMSL